MDTNDIVNKPSHYTRYQIEPVEFIMRNGLDIRYAEMRINLIKGEDIL